MINEFLKELNRVFCAHGVRLAYLFGSQATGQAGPLSDFDFGVLFGSAFSAEERFRRGLELSADLMGILHV